MGTDDSETSATQVTMVFLKLQVTMADFKSLESTMTSQRNELREMMAQLMQAKFPSATPLLEIPASLNVGNAGLEDEDADKNKTNEARSSTKGDRKGEFPHWYYPDPPIPHTHFNNIGDPLIRLKRIYNF
jgi:hypothetical protein